MAQPKRSETHIVQELLAFVQNKLDVMDELSLEQICASSFTEADILNAKKVLADTANTTSRFVTRRRDGNAGKKDLQDIFRVLKETDPDDIPTYVARDLNRLPPVTWDHVDVTRFMKDIMLLKQEISEVRRKLEESECTVIDLKKEVAVLRANAVSTLSPTSSQNINVIRGSGRCDISSVSISDCATDTVPRVDDRVPRDISVAVNTSSRPLTTPAPSSVAPAPPSRIQKKKSYAEASHSSPAAGTSSPAQQNSLKPTPTPDTREPDKDGFTLVKKNKRRHGHRNLNKRGTATSTALKAVEPTFLMYLSRVDPSTPGAEVFKYVQKKLGEASTAMQFQRLESTVRTPNFKSYVLRVPAKHKTALLSPEFWPEGLVFRRYWGATQPVKSQK